jgi:hypothetical protein
VYIACVHPAWLIMRGKASRQQQWLQGREVGSC